MKTKTLLAVGLLCPSLLLAGSWTNLDDAHYCAGQKLTEKDLANKVVAVFACSQKFNYRLFMRRIIHNNYFFRFSPQNYNIFPILQDKM